MSAKTAIRKTVPTTQEVCIDLPGESVRCWRSSDNIKVILRKHRDIFFDVNIKPGTLYSVESAYEFYCPREKKLLRKSQFLDGERLHIWVGREFKGNLLLKHGDRIMGIFEPNRLDEKQYDANPKTKPEPLMVILGNSTKNSRFACTAADPLGISTFQSEFKPIFDPKIYSLKNYGTDFNYDSIQQQPEVKEYVCISEASSEEVQPEVVKQLESGKAVEGSITQIFVLPKDGQKKSDLTISILAFAGEVVKSNWFKESLGYLQEHWRELDKITMRVRIERRVKGKYKVIFKGRPLKQWIAHVRGTSTNTKIVHQTGALGSAKTGFMDGGATRTGKAGYGGAKRIIITATENFRGGIKMQIIGTVIDIFGDINDTFLKEGGSRDLSEFLGRAGVSLVKAGATAAIGGLIATTIGAIAIIAIGTTAVPVYIGVGLVVGGYILAATIVDYVDDRLKIKDHVGAWTK